VGWTSVASFLEDDVVDQADAADSQRGGEDWRVERGDLDVVDVEAVEQPTSLVRIAGGERTGEHGGQLPLLGGEQRVPGREREPVRVGATRLIDNVLLEGDEE